MDGSFCECKRMDKKAEIEIIDKPEDYFQVYFFYE